MLTTNGSENSLVQCQPGPEWNGLEMWPVLPSTLILLQDNVNLNRVRQFAGTLIKISHKNVTLEV